MILNLEENIILIARLLWESFYVDFKIVLKDKENYRVIENVVL